MPDIASVDRNFRVTGASDSETVWLSCLTPPFRVFGLSHDGEHFLRMPLSIAREVNPGTENLAAHTAGGRLRFVTDSPVISIRAVMDRISRMPHFALTGVAGFDLYADSTFCGTFVPPFDMQDGYTSSINLGTRIRREITIHFPTYSGVCSLEIGLMPDSLLEASAPYASPLPFVTYGSSITQGGCVSRPGNTYQNILSRELNADHLNLGFAGNARGEQAMARYIASLPMKAFILDYDHNAPDTEHLKKTHEPFFRTIRESQPDLPILILARPKAVLSETEKNRLDIIRETCEHAQASGDRHVTCIDLSDFLRSFCGNDGTVDNCHPNDLGFRGMAAAIRPWLMKQYE